MHCTVGNIPHGAAYPNRVAVPKKPAYLADYHRNAIGGKAHIKVWVKIVYCFYKTDAADLKKVIGIFSPGGKLLHNA